MQAWLNNYGSISVGYFTFRWLGRPANRTERKEMERKREEECHLREGAINGIEIAPTDPMERINKFETRGALKGIRGRNFHYALYPSNYRILRNRQFDCVIGSQSSH